MRMVDFWLGVLASLVATVLWQLAIKKLNSPFFYPYPDIRQTTWIGTYQIDGKNINEEIKFERQFWKWCSGSFTWSNPENSSERVKYNFSGKFVMHHILAGSFKPEDCKFRDFGTFLYAFQYDTKKAEGGSVSISFKTNKPIVIDYSMTRCS